MSNNLSFLNSAIKNEQAFKTLLAAKGYTYKSRFNFPTVDAFGTLLEKNGFIIDDLYIYDRPTVLKDGKSPKNRRV